jgi:hypothetical protein
MPGSRFVFHPQRHKSELQSCKVAKFQGFEVPSFLSNLETLKTSTIRCLFHPARHPPRRAQLSGGATHAHILKPSCPGHKHHPPAEHRGQ